MTPPPNKNKNKNKTNQNKKTKNNKKKHAGPQYNQKSWKQRHKRHQSKYIFISAQISGLVQDFNRMWCG